MTFRVLSLLLVLAPLACADDAVDFNRDVRPILAGKCYQCHGFDDKARKAGLRIDVRDATLKELKSGETAIVPGKPAASALIARVSSTDDDDVMPPPKNGPRLTPAQVATLGKWVEQGAHYSVHWAYVKPVRPALPVVTNAAWPVNDVDRFVLAKLEGEKLTPSPRADRYALIRRVSLDLTGLPPTIEEADAFANDAHPDAYERLVDRLLASPAYGERWAQVWLDLARYADSQGFANDPDRTIWRWRDWLIKALNENEPYDKFTTDVLAGDLEPGASPDQIVATGFHRNTLTNTEGGTQPEEFRSAAIVDRVNTTMQVWTGSTFACCQCHNHKYDPFSQKDYFSLYAIFNSTADNNTGDDAPTVEAPRYGSEAAWAALKPKYDAARTKLDELTKTVDVDREAWEKSVDAAKLPKDVAAAFAKAPKDRKKPESQKLTEYFRSQSPAWKAAEGELKSLNAQRSALSVSTPVLRELDKPRETHVQLRGNYLALGDKVDPGLPAALASSSGRTPVNRLTLAKWITSPENPLASRVAVNRLWEQLFGTGIVETAEDFGTQGEPPSDPALLDWLATEYVRLGWDTKAILREIVCSATYCQNSAESAKMATRDPNNRLLARGPRVRLSAETVRDEALFAAGLLEQQLYGPPCQPAKPVEGLSAAFGATMDWKTDTDDNRFRRALYIRVRRNAPYPSLTSFDAPERTSCVVRRIRTNTPLQALVTMNDPCFIEAAQGVARRVMKVGAEGRATLAFRLALTRPPSEGEVRRVGDLFAALRQQYAADPKAADALATQPLGPVPAGVDPIDLSAWTAVANTLLNLDESLAKR